MKFMLFILPTVPGTLEDRKRLRPIARNTERYQQMLDEMRKLAVRPMMLDSTSSQPPSITFTQRVMKPRWLP
jgi:hypothetical protein